jgi:molybdopterin-guanine dinucleotide biosynthesis protein MobB
VSPIPAIAFVGRSKTGKTTLIEKIIGILTSQGIRVATIKHHHKGDFDIDHVGKDTYRHKQAGAKMTMIVSPGKLAMVEDLDADPSLDDVLTRFVKDVDLVIIEGFKHQKGPKIEVFKSESGLSPVALGDPDLIAIVADKTVNLPIPVFFRDDVLSISDFIIRTVIRRSS